jgi:hypothetical protein
MHHVVRTRRHSSRAPAKDPRVDATATAVPEDRKTVGILDNFEKGLERVVNGAFARTFKSGLQPVELASALKRELDTNAAIVSRDRILVPNEFVLRMAANDRTRLEKSGPTLIDELTALCVDHATQQGYRFSGPVTIAFEADPELADGMLEIDSRTVRGTLARPPRAAQPRQPAAAEPPRRPTQRAEAATLEINGDRHPLGHGRTVVGRGSDADITVDDTGISRRHVEITWDGRTATARDLGSTNGSTLDGRRLTEAQLRPGSTISIGRTRIVFHLGGGSGRATTSRPQRGGDAFWGDEL